MASKERRLLSPILRSLRSRYGSRSWFESARQSRMGMGGGDSEQFDEQDRRIHQLRRTKPIFGNIEGSLRLTHIFSNAKAYPVSHRVCRLGPQMGGKVVRCKPSTTGNHYARRNHNKTEIGIHPSHRPHRKIKPSAWAGHKWSICAPLGLGISFFLPWAKHFRCQYFRL